MNDNEPWSDAWKRAALRANDLDAAATILEESKSAVLAQRKTQLGDIADNKAERIVKASAEWSDYITKMVKARQRANEAKIEAEWMKMKYYESASDKADERTMARL
jgi:uncharacterized coiled-coil DUF342 family protein